MSEATAQPTAPKPLPYEGSLASKVTIGCSQKTVWFEPHAAGWLGRGSLIIGDPYKSDMGSGVFNFKFDHMGSS